MIILSIIHFSLFVSPIHVSSPVCHFFELGFPIPLFPRSTMLVTASMLLSFYDPRLMQLPPMVAFQQVFCSVSS